MERSQFIKTLLGLGAMASLSSFKKFTDTLSEHDQLMPVLFIGHGSPMNAIEDNEFSKGWKNITKQLPKPKAILCISAHWETNGTQVTLMERPKTIHDFGGFPQALFDVQYPAQGSEWLAQEVQAAVKSSAVRTSDQWGLDHGAWSVLKHMYPAADVPVVQLSLDYTKGPQYHYDLAKELYNLRKKGVLIVSSGNMVHNFQQAKIAGDFNTHFGHDWALEANSDFKKLILANDAQPLINYTQHSKAFQLAAPTPDHYLPLLYTIGLFGKKDKVQIFNDAVIGGSFSMTSVLLH
jgi:4,5-DOPA dioxygenase extradiol